MQMPNTVYVKDVRYEKDEKDETDEKGERKRNCTTTPNLLYELRRGSARWRAVSFPSCTAYYLFHHITLK